MSDNKVNIMKPTPEIQAALTTIRDAVKVLIAKADKDIGANIADTRITELSNSLTITVHDTVIKYAKGQKEHGGDLVMRNLIDEAYQEVLDMIVYIQGMRHQWQPALTVEDYLDFEALDDVDDIDTD